jgi:ubiquinone/menaquinone biosynthesis C-methylase UbiE
MSTATLNPSQITVWKSLEIPIDRKWEAAYQRFETPQQEITKFKKRLDYLGYRNWSKDARVVELFCGRGNGLHALAELGFTNLSGVDLSEELLKSYTGRARLFAGDCRELSFADHACDVVIVQGGLHHLPAIPSDLDLCLGEIRRVLKPTGTFCMVEPWETPFLSAVHATCRNSFARRCWDKLDALAEMIERELQTYQQWLRQPEVIQASIRRHFTIDRQKIGCGKIMLRATPVAD